MIMICQYVNRNVRQGLNEKQSAEQNVMREDQVWLMKLLQHAKSLVVYQFLNVTFFQKCGFFQHLPYNIIPNQPQLLSVTLFAVLLPEVFAAHSPYRYSYPTICTSVLFTAGSPSMYCCSTIYTTLLFIAAKSIKIRLSHQLYLSLVYCMWSIIIQLFHHLYLSLICSWQSIKIQLFHLCLVCSWYSIQIL